MPDLMLHPRTGQTIPKDKSAFEIVLCCHGETPGGAWIVSVAPDGGESASISEGGKFYLPKRMAERSEPCGGFERMDHRCQRKLVTLHEFSMPKFIAVEKGLAP